VACGERTTLRELFAMLRAEVARFDSRAAVREPDFQPFRPGDIRHSLADVSKARRLLGYEVVQSVREGLVETVPWYVEEARKR